VVAAAKRVVQKAAAAESAPVPGQPGLLQRKIPSKGLDIEALKRNAERILRKARAEMQSPAQSSLVSDVLNVQPRIVFPSGSLSGSLVPYLENF